MGGLVGARKSWQCALAVIHYVVALDSCDLHATQSFGKYLSMQNGVVSGVLPCYEISCLL